MTKLKTFEIWENINYCGDSQKVAMGYIKAKNLDTAVKRALKECLTKEQRKKCYMQISDSDLESYIFETKYYDLDGNELENVKEYNEDTMTYEDHELVIQEVNGA